jgi:nucleoside triphosphate diphosphatase
MTAAPPEEADSSILADAAPTSTPLAQAVALGRCAGQVGFDWAAAREVRGKVLEELAELDAAVASGAGEAIVEELGDLLFAVANWGRHLGAQPEAALGAANEKFRRRFTWMERTARARALELPSLSAAAWEALWRESKLAVG